MSFYKVLSKYYDVIFQGNPMQIEFIKGYLKSHSSILDIAAGSGNQSIELARLNYKVTAIDLDPVMVLKTKQKKGTELKNITAKVLDMRNIDQLGLASFNTAICVGNSIVHLDSYNEIKKVVEKVYLSLKEEGIFIIQVVNYDRILKENITQLPIIERKEQGIKFVRTYKHINQRIIFNGELIINHDGTKEAFHNSVELYPLTSIQLKEVLISSGFKKVELFGDFKRNDFSITSPALIGVGQK